ncbi:MAG: arginine deiminase-related protein [Myxococcota bacterium]
MPPDPLAQPSRPPSTRVLMADPEHFDVTYVINPHMAGHVGTVDRDLARAQWEALRQVYLQLGLQVDVLPAVPGFPDLVFVANQTFPTQPRQGPPAVILSHMHAAERRGEVPIVARWFREQGWQLLDVPEQPRDGIMGSHFEGMGDANWHPGRRLVYGGYGWRTARRAYEDRLHLIDAEVVTLELQDVRLYHLDTCVSPLDEHTALICDAAFSERGLAALSACFPRLIRAPVDEAMELLAVNGHCPDGKHFVVQRGAVRTVALVREAGFEVIEVDTSEFLKSGGSVQCMKLMLD